MNICLQVKTGSPRAVCNNALLGSDGYLIQKGEKKTILTKTNISDIFHLKRNMTKLNRGAR